MPRSQSSSQDVEHGSVMSKEPTLTNRYEDADGLLTVRNLHQLDAHNKHHDAVESAHTRLDGPVTERLFGLVEKDDVVSEDVASAETAALPSSNINGKAKAEQEEAGDTQKKDGTE